MVDFALSDAERMVQQMAHDFAAREIRPRAAEYDEREEFPWDIARQGAALGLSGMPLGGRAVEPGLTPYIVAEELAWGCGGIGIAMTVNCLPATAISVIGTDEQAARFLPLCTPTDGTLHFGSLALTEPDAGSDAGSITTTAVRDGDDYVINGTKRFITGGGIGDLTIVFAKENTRDGGFKNFNAFVVPTNTPGFSEGAVWKKMGIRASHTADLNFDNVRIPADHRLGAAEPAFRSGGRGALGTLSATRPYIGALAVGIARSAFEHAAAYALDRH